MFESAIIPLFFLLSAVTADICEYPRIPCTPAGCATQDKLNGIFFRSYRGNIDNYIDAPANDTQKLRDGLDLGLPFVLYCSGYRGSAESNTTRYDMLTALLATHKFNVAETFWDPLACDLYPVVVTNVCAVGKVMGGFLNDCVKSGIAPTSIHLIGHSLGAHICGHAGRETPFLVESILGLDCAGPEWYDPNQCLNKCCAKTVHAWHTDDYVLGKPDALADADFYPNGGHAVQPKCCNVADLLTPTAISCSHNSAPTVMAESIRNPNLFRARQCDSMSNMNNCQCNSNPMVAMDYPPSDTTPPGKYYLNTGGDPPYGLGDAGATGTCPVIAKLIYNIFG